MSPLPRSELRRKLLALLGIAAGLWLVLMLVGGDSGALALFRARGAHADLESRVEQLEAENERLRAEIRSLEEDPAEVERIAREELMMARPNEEVLLVPDPPHEGHDL